MIVLHAAAAVWHGTAHTDAQIAMTAPQDVFVAVAVGIAPLTSGFMLFVPRLHRYGYALLAFAMFASFLFGALHHYFIESPDAVWNVVPGQWTSAFRSSAAALLITEFCGSLVGVAGIFMERRDDGTRYNVIRNSQ